MAELENKIKQEAEMREEALLKRISEKDKQITKMKWVRDDKIWKTQIANLFPSFSGVVEAYEKAISELIAEKEQLSLAYDKKCNDLKHDSEMNSNHLESLEATFSDLHSWVFDLIRRHAAKINTFTLLENTSEPSKWLRSSTIVKRHSSTTAKRWMIAWRCKRRATTRWNRMRWRNLRCKFNFVWEVDQLGTNFSFFSKFQCEQYSSWNEQESSGGSHATQSSTEERGDCARIDQRAAAAKVEGEFWAGEDLWWAHQWNASQLNSNN